MIKKDGANVILTAAPDKIIIADLKNKKACKDYADCISGTFQYANAPCSILIANGKVINNCSAHAWLGYPDTCLIYYTDGTFAVKRLTAIPADELPRVQWAISGVGLLGMYDPATEGYAAFKKEGKSYNYSDVLRRTDHTVIGVKADEVYGLYVMDTTTATDHTAIGVKNGEVYGLYVMDATATEVNAYCKKLGLQMAVMLDGGHIAAVNCGAAKINAAQKQSNIIQFVQEPTQAPRKKVCIDPGHGGTDPGAIGFDGIKEKDVVLSIAQLLRDALKRCGIDVVMTREADVPKGKLVIEDRCKLANAAGVDYLVSVHANAASIASAHGTETYSFSKTSKGYTLAQAVQKELVADNGLADRGVKIADFAILRGAVAPAILVETAFISNKAEEKLLSSPDFQRLTAEAIAKGVTAHLGLAYVPPGPVEEELECNLRVEDQAKGTAINLTIDQENRNGTIWAPIRQVAQALGCTVEYDADEKCVVIYK